MIFHEWGRTDSVGRIKSGSELDGLANEFGRHSLQMKGRKGLLVFFFPLSILNSWVYEIV